MNPIPFNKPFIVGKELYYISQAVLNGHLAGNGEFTKRCHEYLTSTYKARKVLLTTSCTTALEMAALLCDVAPGDEVIMPSFTFVSTANAFVLRGAKPIFVDIRHDTLNLDVQKLPAVLTGKTKVICPVHYAGVGCEMNEIMSIAREKSLMVVEDAAQAMNAQYYDRYLGTIGDFGTFSFHETKNFISGEGGALLINNPAFIERAEILWEKGTNRNKFFRGEVDKYTWVDVGSSFLPSELIAAFLCAQFEMADVITAKRLRLWQTYHEALKRLADKGMCTRPFIPDQCLHNGHLYYLLLNSEVERIHLQTWLAQRHILAIFHFVPLHLSPMGQKFGYRIGDFPVTEDISSRLLRLPMYFNLTYEEQHDIIEAIYSFFD
jgi:dTDP-4-amino-4,6-dideoxygalactose transaminase